MKIKDSYNEVFEKVTNILAVLAHPDDMEITCGGLLARLCEDGKKVRLLVTTNGGKGMKDKKLEENSFGETRVKEQIKAGEILGIPSNQNFNLNLPDGQVELTYENIGKIVSHIREFKPELIITHNAHDKIINFNNQSHWVNHRDHRHTGLLVLDAMYPYSRDKGFFPEHFEKNLQPHTVTKLLVSDSYLATNVKHFNIDSVLEKKKFALQQHISAFDPDDADDYLDENKTDSGYFEPLGYYNIY